MKLKRFFTGVLSAVMALGVCALPAAAADATTGAATTSKYTTSTIDTGKEGSITIYKRSMTSALPTEPAGNGETTAPAGEPLENVGFTIYQVMDAGELVKYYDGITKGNAVTYKDYFDSDAEFTASTLKDNVKSKEVKGLNGEPGEKKTNVDGKVEFTGLEVGLYLVIETALPQAVTQKADPFLVSIPMTRIGAGKDETENPNNKVWMYDVTVYPKNSIAQGDVTLEKKGVTGSDTANAVSLDGVKFTLYRKSDTDGKYTAVADCTDKVTASGQIQFSNLRKGSYYIMETGYADDADAGYILDTKAKYAFAIDKDGKVAENTDLTGADVVKATEGVFAIDPTKSKLTVYNYKPDVEKTVTKRDGSSTVTNTDGTTVGNHEADYGVGDKVTYTLTIDVPANIAKLKTFTVTDTTVAKQLVHDTGSVTVSAKNKDDKEVKDITSAYGKADIKTEGANSVLTIAFTPANLESVAGGQITITYTATVQKDAVVAGSGNVNSAKLQYSRTTDKDKTEEGGNKPYEIEDQSVVYTFSTSLLKKGEGGTYGDKAMPNVTFELYKKVENSEWKNDAVTIAGKSYQKKDVVRPEDIVALGLSKDKTETWIKITYDGKDEGTTGPDGKLTYTGLPKGTYRFVETKTLNGYNLLSKPVDAKLTLDYTTTWDTSSTYENGVLVKHKYNTTSYKSNGKDATPGAEITIINRSGFTLPVTGGFGTLLFSGIGVLLVLAGVAVLFSMKKKNDRA